MASPKRFAKHRSGQVFGSELTAVLLAIASEEADAVDEGQLRAAACEGCLLREPEAASR